MLEYLFNKVAALKAWTPLVTDPVSTLECLMEGVRIRWNKNVLGRKIGKINKINEKGGMPIMHWRVAVLKNTYSEKLLFQKIVWSIPWKGYSERQLFQITTIQKPIVKICEEWICIHSYLVELQRFTGFNLSCLNYHLCS